MKKSTSLQKIFLTIAVGHPKSVLTEIVKDRKLVKNLMKLARINGVQYYYLERLKTLNADLSFLDKKYSKEMEQGLTNLRRTITTLNEVSKDHGIPYILIKSCNTIPHIPRDVDIFVREQEKEAIVEGLKKYGMKCEHSDGDIEITLVGKGYLSIDVYTRIIYFGKEFLDEDFLFNSLTKKELFGVKYYGLKNEAEFMLNLLHCLFGHRCIKLLDFLHLRNIRDGGLSIKFCEEYAEKMGWKGVFSLALRRLEAIEKGVYSEREKVTFPYPFDTKFLIECVRQIEGMNLSKADEIVILLSFLLDFAKLKLESSMLRDIIRRIQPLRTLLLTIGYKSRSLRGDKYS